MRTYIKAIGMICGLLAVWMALGQVVEASPTHILAARRMQPSVVAPADAFKLAIDKRDHGNRVHHAKETVRA